MKRILQKTLDELMRLKCFRDYINGRISKNYLGQRFCIDELSQLHNLYSIQSYHMNDLKVDDVVLDLGANIGAFSLPASTKCKWVYAFEPLYSDVLQKNCELNNIKNISIFPVGVGKHCWNTIQHGNRTVQSAILTLKEALRLCEDRISFLKMDIEGYEWFIDPSEFEGIRRIEAEIHFTNGKANNGNHEVSDMLELLKDYHVDYEHHGEYAIVHARQ